MSISINKRITTATLPLVYDLVIKLAPKRIQSTFFYPQQLKTLNPQSDKKNVVKSECCKVLAMLILFEILPMNSKKNSKAANYRISFHGG